MSNKFYCIPKGGSLREWNVHAPPAPDFPQDCHYFGKVLSCVDAHSAARDLTFLMTWDINAVPFAGDGVVVLLIGDERYQLPAYASKVLAVFKTGGLAQFIPPGFWSGAPGFMFLELLRAWRNRALLGLRFVRHGLRRRFWDRVFPLPLGYFCHLRPSFKPMGEREHDVFYAGATSARPLRKGNKSLPRSPKEYARNAMAEAVNTLRKQAPQLKLRAPSERLDFDAYAATMMNSKICLCPRGNFIETFRHLEAARFGCVVVSEPLPPLWYYSGVPTVQISRWEQMPDVVRGLFQQPGKIEELSAATLEWWKKGPAEEVVASYIVGQLGDCFQGRPPRAEELLCQSTS